MSIVACVKVYDAIVLGADSRTSLTSMVNNNPQVFQTFNNAQKLFDIVLDNKPYPIGVLTYGAGNIGKRSVESYIHDFTESIENFDGQVQTLAKDLHKFLNDVYDKRKSEGKSDANRNLGIYVAGYSAGSPIAEEWEFIVPNHEEIKSVRNKDNFGASWRGISIPFSRLFMGFDPRFEGNLKKLGLDDKTFQKVLKLSKQHTSNMTFDGMPPQDAIEYCKFILDTTVNMAKFEIGPSSCGGPLDIAIITRKNGFNWVRQKKFNV